MNKEIERIKKEIIELCNEEKRICEMSGDLIDIIVLYNKCIDKIAEKNRELKKALVESGKSEEWANNYSRAFTAYNNYPELLNDISKFEVLNGSPYSNSFYNSDDIDWNYKPEGSIRISDHWNFKSYGNKHCQLENTDEYTEKLMMCEYHNGKYRIIKEY